MEIAPSIFAADLGNLEAAAEQCRRGGARLLHVDVMDGHFVPNLTFGPPVIAGLKDKTEIPLDIHLMVSDPDRLLDLYLDLEPQWVSVHVEAATHLDRTVQHIRERGVGAGVVLNPGTSIEMIREVLPLLDFVLLMSVNPGFSGQAFIPYVLEKVRRLRAEIDKLGLSTMIEIDGGVDGDNLDEVKSAGVDVAVSGSGVFGAEDPAARLSELLERARA